MGHEKEAVQLASEWRSLAAVGWPTRTENAALPPLPQAPWVSSVRPAAHRLAADANTGVATHLTSPHLTPTPILQTRWTTC